jgi:hypothetical protein
MKPPVAPNLWAGESTPGIQIRKSINVHSFNKTILPCHAPIAGALQKPADLLLTVDLEHKEATTVQRHEPAAGIQPFSSEYTINLRSKLRVEICCVHAHSVVRFSRVNLTAAGNEKRSGSVFEVGLHHIDVIAQLLSDVERELGRFPNARR